MTREEMLSAEVRHWQTAYQKLLEQVSKGIEIQPPPPIVMPSNSAERRRVLDELRPWTMHWDNCAISAAIRENLWRPQLGVKCTCGLAAKLDELEARRG